MNRKHRVCHFQAKYEQREKFNYKEDRIDTFFANFISNDDFKDLWQICKLIFVLSHGQSNIERGFSVSKEVLQENLQEQSLISQCLIYDTLQCSNIKVHNFTVSPALHKSCKLAYGRYKNDLERKKEEKKESDATLKRKASFEELEAAKKVKITLVESIEALKEGLISETISADKTKNMSCVTKAASFVHSMRDKEKELAIVCKKINNLEDEHKKL